jgi:hypothetical protein
MQFKELQEQYSTTSRNPMETVPSKGQPQLYIEVNVWKRIDQNTLMRYRCFRILPDDKYVVQSADFYTLPLDDKQLSYLSKQFIELLCEEEPAVRSGLYDSLEEAIAAHDLDFPF